MARTKKTAPLMLAMQLKTEGPSSSDGDTDVAPAAQADRLGDEHLTGKHAGSSCEDEEEYAQVYSSGSKQGSPSGNDGFGTSTSTRSRKRALMKCGGELFYVEGLEKDHENWKKFEEYLLQYQQNTMTVLAVSETLNVRLRNRQIRKMKMFAGLRDSDLPLIPEPLDPFKRVYICTHGWKNRENGLFTESASPSAMCALWHNFTRKNVESGVLK
ncbi:hypothetical protein PInf_019056 [Phytophthora infestans]|nr:hypothetical protein PInf_019056 [Phytophthora infestans]